jgi:hypothetical protein
MSLTNFPFFETTKIYDTLDFIHNAGTRVSQVVIWWMPKPGTVVGTQIPSNDILKLDIEYTDDDPAVIYRSPGPRNLIDSNGLGAIESFCRMPVSARKCYQCEYDEYIYKTSLNPDEIADKRDIINIAVWKAVSKYYEQQQQRI